MCQVPGRKRKEVNLGSFLLHSNRFISLSFSSTEDRLINRSFSAKVLLSTPWRLSSSSCLVMGDCAVQLDASKHEENRGLSFYSFSQSSEVGCLRVHLLHIFPARLLSLLSSSLSLIHTESQNVLLSRSLSSSPCLSCLSL